MPKIFQILACVTQGVTTVSKYVNVTLYQVSVPAGLEFIPKVPAEFSSETQRIYHHDV